MKKIACDRCGRELCKAEDYALTMKYYSPIKLDYYANSKGYATKIYDTYSVSEYDLCNDCWKIVLSVIEKPSQHKQKMTICNIEKNISDSADAIAEMRELFKKNET